LDGAANRLNETFAVSRIIKVLLFGSIYDDATFEQDGRHLGRFQHDQIVEGVDAFSLLDDRAVFLLDVMQRERKPALSSAWPSLLAKAKLSVAVAFSWKKIE
jgi:hypothetical protein